LWENIQQALDRPLQGHRPSKRGVPDAHSTQPFIDKENITWKDFGRSSRLSLLAVCEELVEPLVIRPTSETIIGICGRVVQSLPRFSRTDEPVEQRGSLGIAARTFPQNAGVLLARRPHAHATREEAEAETRQM